MIGYLWLGLVLIIIGVHLKFLVKKIQRNRKLRPLLGDGIKDDDVVIVRYKGRDLPMTYMEKIELWDNMDREQKRTMSTKIGKAIDKGKLKSEQTRPDAVKIFIE